MKLPILSSLTRRVGLDLGSSHTRIWTDLDGVVLNEPTCLAVDERSNKVVAVGEEAVAMEGRVGPSVTLYRPVRNGKLYDMDVARALLKVFLQRVLKSNSFFRPSMMVNVAAAATEVDRAAVTELLYSVGAKEVYSISQPLAAAIGAGVPVADASGSFILQLGSGIVEAGVISLASLVKYESSRIGGDVTDVRIKNQIQDEVGLAISLETAQQLKEHLGSLLSSVTKEELVTGQDLVEMSPKEVKLTTDTIRPPLIKLAQHYETMLKTLFSQIQPELTADVIDKGMLLSGGFGRLNGLDMYLVNRLGIPVSVVEEPELATIKGIATALENLELFKESLGYRS